MNSGSPWRSTCFHLTLLGLTLVGAWLTFSRPFDDDPTAATRVVVVDAAEGDVERLVWERGEQRLDIESRWDDRGRWFLGVDGAGGRFNGGQEVAAIFRALEPLRALRVIDEVTATKREELGLAGGDRPSESLSLRIGGREVRFRFGDSPFGASDRYAIREGAADDGGPFAAETTGRVLVLPSQVVAGLAGGASLLMERRLLEAARPEVEAMTLERPVGANGAAPLRIVQRNGASLADTHWTLDGSDVVETEVGAWVDKFFRLSAAGYRGGEPAPNWRFEARVTVEARGSRDAAVDIWSASTAASGADAASGTDEADASAVGADGLDQMWFARSPFTRLVVELSPSLAEEVTADLDDLLPMGR